MSAGLRGERPRPAPGGTSFPRSALLALASLLAGCGYTSGLRLPEHYHSVGLEVFGNDTPEVDLERGLHAAMARQLVQLVRSPLEPPARADVLVDGRILEYSRRDGIRDGTDNRLLESAIVVRAEAWLVDRRSGEVLGEPAKSGVRIGYVIGEERGELQARDRALLDVAQRLVLELFSRLD